MTGAGRVDVADGWAALAEARWDDAYTAFSAALATEETAEAFEGLSWAAWWRDDADAVFEARERAYRLYLSAREQASAARMATWLAADELDFHYGNRRLQRLIRRHTGSSMLEPGPDHGWLAFHEGYLAHLTGDDDTAGERARFAASWDGGSKFPTSRCSGSRSKVPCSSEAATSRTA